MNRRRRAGPTPRWIGCSTRCSPGEGPSPANMGLVSPKNRGGPWQFQRKSARCIGRSRTRWTPKASSIQGNLFEAKKRLFSTGCWPAEGKHHLAREKARKKERATGEHRWLEKAGIGLASIAVTTATATTTATTAAATTTTVT